MTANEIGESSVLHVGHKQPKNHRWAIWLLKLAGPAFYVPLTTLADHRGIVTRDYRALFIGMSALLIGLGIALLLGNLGVKNPANIDLAVFAVTAFATGSGIVRAVPGRELGFAVMLVIFLAALVKLDRPKLLSYSASWLSLTLWLLVASSIVQAAWDAQPSLTTEHPTEIPRLADPSGDVVVLVLDEFPSLEFASKHLGLDGEGFAQELRRVGFVVDEALPASYAFTEVALPSFFLLELPISEGETLSESTRKDLLGAVGGRNPFVAAFREVDYRVTVVESGWSGLRCMEWVDSCVKRSWYDEVTAAILSRSVAGPMLQKLFGSPFSHGAERSIQWINSDLQRIADDSVDDLIIIHMMLPHTPLAFDEECMRLDREADLDTDAFGDQVLCAQRVAENVAVRTKEALVTVIMGDHGSRLLGQTEIAPAQWTDDMILERMRTMVAVRQETECDEPAAGSSTNVGVRVLRCLGAEVSYVDDVALATSVHGDPFLDTYRP